MKRLSGRSGPLGIAAGAGTAALAGTFIVDWHRGLQFIGVAGPLASLAVRALQYDSPQARPCHTALSIP